MFLRDPYPYSLTLHACSDMSHLIWLLMDFNKPNLAVMDVVRKQPARPLHSTLVAVMLQFMSWR